MNGTPRARLVVLAVASGLVGLIGRRAIDARQARPDTITVSVVYKGGGEWSRTAETMLAMADCHIKSASTEKSAFHWTITWGSVTIPLKATGRASMASPSGTLELTYNDTFDKTATGCAPPPRPHCQVTDQDQVAHEEDFARLTAELQSDGQILFTADADASPEGMATCPSAAGDTNQQHFLYLGNYGPSRHASDPSPLEAMGVKVPLTEALAFGKIVVPVKNGPANLPGTGFDCTNKILGGSCTESQTWQGSLEITRIK